ncbi:MAG: prepilin-type N-terminal cleavage/methylation domain-containing protein [Candidatus Aureabacteria bacterium]|nr:prepilin-type N-terminal cleavage/methylation domain-containing protein [Candidatus Auribacterota bacterium]
MKTAPISFKRVLRGFSLVELMIAIFVFLVIFSWVMKGLSNIVQVQKQSQELAIASQILGDVTEKICYLRSTGGWDMIETSTLSFTSSTVAELTSLKNASVNATVVPYKDQYGADVPTLKKVALVLNWISQNGVAKSETFQIVLSKPPAGA